MKWRFVLKNAAVISGVLCFGVALVTSTMLFALSLGLTIAILLGLL
jgi:hypothetical protein